MNKKSTIPSMPAPPARGSQMPPKGHLQTVPPPKPSNQRRVIWNSATRYSGTNISQEIINVK